MTWRCSSRSVLGSMSIRPTSSPAFVARENVDAGPARCARFGTTRREILHLADWLTHEGVTHVAMESTGVFWKPVFNILEGHVEVILVNAEHYKAVPGRKTDVRDCEWLAQLLEHGLLRASFIPPQPIRAGGSAKPCSESQARFCALR